MRTEGSYYKSIMAADPTVHVLPYFCHPSIYTTGLHAFAQSLAILERQQSILLIFSGSSSGYYSRLQENFSLLNREQIIAAMEAFLHRPDSRICASALEFR